MLDGRMFLKNGIKRDQGSVKIDHRIGCISEEILHGESNIVLLNHFAVNVFRGYRGWELILLRIQKWKQSKLKKRTLGSLFD